MTANEYILEEKKKLLNFCRNHKKIYIYGAGSYGKAYFDIIKANGYDIDGFIVTYKSQSDFMGKNVYSIGELEEFAYDNVGIVPAYTNSRSEDIKKRFNDYYIDVLEFNHRIIVALHNELLFFPILTGLEERFPSLHKWRDKVYLNNILIVRLDAIGDMIFTTAFIRELKMNYPYANISIVIRKQNHLLLYDCPYVDNIYLYDQDLIKGELAEQSLLYESIRRKVECFCQEQFGGKKFDAVFFPREFLCGCNTIDELLFGYISGARYKIGRIVSNEIDKVHLYNRIKESFSYIAMQNEPEHEVEYALSLLKDCGCVINNKAMELWINESSREYARCIINEFIDKKNTSLIAIGLVASVETRTWKAENYISLFNMCEKENGDKIKFVLLGGLDAAKVAERLHQFSNIVLDLTGKTTLDQTIAIMEQCDIYVGSNTGLLHMASALKKASVTIYSELDDGKKTDVDSPYRMGAWMVPHIDLIPESGLDGCRGVCRMKKSHCINLIRPHQVLRGIMCMLNTKE